MRWKCAQQMQLRILAIWFQEANFLKSGLLCSNTIPLLKLQIELCAQSKHGYLNKQTNTHQECSSGGNSNSSYNCWCGRQQTRVFHLLNSKLLSVDGLMNCNCNCNIYATIGNLMCFALFLAIDFISFHFISNLLVRSDVFLFLFLSLSFVSKIQFMRMNSSHLKYFKLEKNTQEKSDVWMSLSFALLFFLLSLHSTNSHFSNTTRIRK